MKRIDISEQTHQQLQELSQRNMRAMTVELAMAVKYRWELLQKSSTGSLGDQPTPGMMDVKTNGKR